MGSTNKAIASWWYRRLKYRDLVECVDTMMQIASDGAVFSLMKVEVFVDLRFERRENP